MLRNRPEQRIKTDTHEIFYPIIQSIREEKNVGSEANRSKTTNKNKRFIRFGSIRLRCTVFFQPCILMPYSRKLCDAGEILFRANTTFLCSNFLLLFLFVHICDIAKKLQFAYKHPYLHIYVMYETSEILLVCFFKFIYKDVESMNEHGSGESMRVDCSLETHFINISDVVCYLTIRIDITTWQNNQ